MEEHKTIYIKATDTFLCPKCDYEIRGFGFTVKNAGDAGAIHSGHGKFMDDLLEDKENEH